MLTLFERVRDWWQARRTQQITPEAVRERVQRGATYLDDLDPGWHRRVDADTLELDDGRHCILGQLHGEFRLGLGRSHLISMSSAPRASLSPVAYGFKCVEHVSDEWKARDYELLNEAWSKAVRTRQEADAALDETNRRAASGDSVPEHVDIELSSFPEEVA
jgi:hypothetical protein